MLLASHGLYNTRLIFPTKGYEFFPISSVTGEGLDQLLRFLADKVEEGRRLREAEGTGRETVIEGG